MLEKFKIHDVSNNINIKLIFILKIFLIIFIVLNKYNDLQIGHSIDGKEFNKILPKIRLNDTTIPSKYDIFKSRELFISDSNLTRNYIKYIRQQKLKNEIIYTKKINRGLEPDLTFTKNRSHQMKIKDFYDLCLNEKLILNESNFNNKTPSVISVLIISYNKKDIILKSIRSIQNQSLKNIEIIIIDDHSTDNSSDIYQYLLKNDERIRVFTHLHNMGCWRSRLDGFLYSNSPYVIHFDAGDFYADNYILEDIYYLANKYNLDSIRFGFRLTKTKKHLSRNDRLYSFKKRDRKIFYGNRKYNVSRIIYGSIWNRLTKANIFNKGLYRLDEYILNSYKNIYEDRWWNTLANIESYSFLMINRIGYIYLKDSKGQGNIRSGDENINNKTIKEIILFFLFDYNLASIKNDKSNIINNLRIYKKGRNKLKLSALKSNFPPYNHLIKCLINDKYVSKKNKKFLLSLKHELKF